MDAPRASTLASLSTAVDAGICRAFRRVGRAVARWPYAIMVVCLLVTAGCGVAFRMLFEQELDGEDLYTPANAQSFKDQDYVRKTFGSPGQLVRVLVTRDVDLDSELDCGRRNLLRSDLDAKRVLTSYMDLYGLIASQSVTSDNKMIKLRDVCYKPDASVLDCEVFSIFGIWNYSRNVMEADGDLLKSIDRAAQQESLTSYLGTPLPSSLVIGRNPDPGPCFGQVEVFQMMLFLRNDKVTVNGLTKDHESSAWNQKLLETLKGNWNRNELQAYAVNYDAVDLESQRWIDKDVKKLILGYVLIFIFSHVVLFKNSPVFCKAHLATGSIISVVMAIITSFGLAQIFRIRFNLVVQTLPFLLLGLGMDDTFVIMGAYHSTDMNLSVEDRMAETMARAGSSILVTTVTDALAFAVGSYTELPALHDFAIYAFLGIVFDFIYQVTFFASLVVLDARRESRARMGAPAWGIKCFSPAPQVESPMSLKVSIRPEDSDTTVDMSASSICNGRNWKRKIIGAGEFDPDKPSIATRIAGKLLPKVTLHPVGSAAVGVIELLLLAAAIYGCTKVKMDFRYREWFVPGESHLTTAFDVDDKYFYGDQILVTVFTRAPTDGMDFYFHLSEYENMIFSLKRDEYVAAIPPLTSWYDTYSVWLRFDSPFVNDLDKNGRAPNVTTFNQSVRLFLLEPAGVYFRDHVVFGGNGIVATQLSCYTEQIVDGSFAVATVDGLRKSLSKSAPALDPGAYSEFFLFYDGFKLITRETIRNVVMAGVVVFIIMTIILANVVAAAIVTLMIALTDTMLFGFLWYVGLSFNTVTSINMVLAVGIAVDYSAHIAHSFLVLDGSRKERAQGALYDIGGEVIAGAFTTWLAVAVMGFAKHYIFTTFFKMFFAIVVTGVWHGLVVLPILLSMIGPPSYAAHTS